MAKNLILVNTKPDILKYDNRKAIELSQTLGRPLTLVEYETLKIKKIDKPKKLKINPQQRYKDNPIAQLIEIILVEQEQ